MKNLLAWIVVGVIAGYLVWWVVPAYFQSNSDPQSIEHLNQEAAKLNRSLPGMIDKETELTVAEGAHAMFIYKYRLVNVAVGRFDHQKFSETAKPQLVQRTCDQPEMREDFLKKGVTLRYSYFDKDKQHIATVDVTPADCGF